MSLNNEIIDNIIEHIVKENDWKKPLLHDNGVIGTYFDKLKSHSTHLKILKSDCFNFEYLFGW